MSTFDLYGARCSSLRAIRDLVAAKLGVEFGEYESSFLGGIYYRAGEDHDALRFVRKRLRQRP